MRAVGQIDRRLSRALGAAEHSLWASVHGSTVRIAGPAAQLDRLRHFYAPYYELRHDSASDADVEIVVCSEWHNDDRSAITDMRVFLRPSKPTVVGERFACFSRPVTGIEVVCDRASGRILLKGRRATEVALQGRTLVRDQVFRQIEKLMGSVVFHASAIELEGLGVAFVGARNCGKTASLLAFLSKRRANLVSGDRVKLCAADNETITMAGTPARCNIHRVALMHDPLLQSIASNSSVRYDREGKALVDAKSIVQSAGVKLLPAARLDVVMFPKIIPGPEPIHVERLTDSEEVKRLMRHNVIEGTRKDRHVHWLGLIPDPPSTLAERIEHVLERLGRIAFVRVSGGYESYVRAIEGGLLDRLTPARLGSPRRAPARAGDALPPCRALHTP
jgi:hypothetical protein